MQELNDDNGLYYGINQISKNVNIADRKALLNGNGFTFGVPGSGKSFSCKQEMGQVFLHTHDDLMIIDPMGEYQDIAAKFGGSVVNLSAYTKNYVNPLDVDIMNINEKGIRDVIADKSEFMLSVCDHLLGNSLNQKHHSIIDRCVRDLYMRCYRRKKVPLMTDFYNILKSQEEMEAQELALCLELFVEGSLNIFNHHTNVDEDNRLVVYCIQDLGTQLAPIAMLVMMEAIQSRIIENGRRGRATWLYIDECHVLLNSDYSATYLQQLWKKVRKQGGLCTGISQNVTDLLQNYIASTLISNSEFIVLLKQSNIDSAKLAEVLGVSDAQLRFVNNSPSGTGLIKCGSVVVPFDNTISKDTDLYKLFNTNIHEKIAEGLIGYGEDADREQADEDFSSELGAEISGLMESGYGNSLEGDVSGAFDNGPDRGFSEPEPYSHDDVDRQDTKDLTRISANVRDLVRREQIFKAQEENTKKPELIWKDREQAESRDSVPKMGLIREPDFAEDDAQEGTGSSRQEGQTYSKAYLDRVFEEELKKSRERRRQAAGRNGYDGFGNSGEQTGAGSGNNWMIYG